MGISLKAVLGVQTGRGLEIRKGFRGAPDAQGILVEEELSLPAFERAAYHANPWWWPGAGCMRVPYVARDFREQKFPEGGQFLLVRVAADRFIAVLPMAGEASYSWLAVADGRLLLRAGTHGRAPVEGDLPLFAWATATEPYRACQDAWRAAVGWPGVTVRLREDKPYGEVFRYLGWCSWEEFFRGINEQNMVATLRAMAESPIPVRYAILDDGHQDYSREDKYFERALKSFQAHPERFPHGYGPLVAEKSPGKVRWLGGWSTLLGGLSGVEPQNSLGRLNDDLMPVHNGCLAPKDDPKSAERFMEAMIGAFKAAGFDLVKIDFISSMIMWYSGAEQMLQRPPDNTHATDNPARTCARLSRALEAAVRRHGIELLDCNANGSPNLFNFSGSNVTRCSDDYSKGNRDRARSHLFHSYSIIPWLGQVAWGDHDMFHSCDPVAARTMAVSKAMSGGPVYLSDNPKDFVAEYIRPLCYEDGELLRPLAPASPLPDGLFLDPENEARPWRVVAPLAGQAAAVAAYNLTKAEVPMQAAVGPDDYADAGCMMQPYPGRWAIPDEGLVVWDWYAARGQKLAGDYSFTLSPLADRLLLLAPVRYGWAVIGRTDKYLSPAAATVQSVSRRELRLTLAEAGRMTIYSAGGPPMARGLDFVELGGGFWRAEMPIGARTFKLVIRR